MYHTEYRINRANLANIGIPDVCEYISLKRSKVLEPGDWVSLSVLPSEYADDMALLLCEADTDQWVTWIPGLGEIQLCLRQLCPV